MSRTQIAFVVVAILVLVVIVTMNRQEEAPTTATEPPVIGPSSLLFGVSMPGAGTLASILNSMPQRLPS